MIQHISDCAKLHNGVDMPWLGLGVFQTEEGDEVLQAVETALKAGYRHIDTAAMYQNERGVGQAVRNSGVPREDVFVTTKVWNSDQGFDNTLRAFDKSQENLNLDYIDLYLIHWPKDQSTDTWKALEKLYQDGMVKAIGVSNFKPHHLDDIFKICDIKPMVNQVELHPWFNQQSLRDLCAEHQIQIEAWAPLGRGDLLEHPVVVEIAQKHDREPAQVLVRWHLQNGIVTIPKSSKPERIRSNADVYGFELDEEDMNRINDIDENKRLGPDPDEITF